MKGIFGILESSATQWYQDVASTQEFFFVHRHIYSLWTHELQAIHEQCDFFLRAILGLRDIELV